MRSAASQIPFLCTTKRDRSSASNPAEVVVGDGRVRMPEKVPDRGQGSALCFKSDRKGMTKPVSVNATLDACPTRKTREHVPNVGAKIAQAATSCARNFGLSGLSEGGLVERLPVTRDAALSSSKGHGSRTDEIVELVLQLVLDVVARMRVRLLRVGEHTCVAIFVATLRLKNGAQQWEVLDFQRLL